MSTTTADETDWLTLLRAEFAPVDGQQVDVLGILWTVYDTKADLGGNEVRAAYCRARLYEGLMKGEYSGVLKWTSADVSEDNSGAFGALSGLHGGIMAEIARLEENARRARGITTMTLTSTARRTGGAEFG